MSAYIKKMVTRVKAHNLLLSVAVHQSSGSRTHDMSGFPRGAKHGKFRSQNTHLPRRLRVGRSVCPHNRIPHGRQEYWHSGTTRLRESRTYSVKQLNLSESFPCCQLHNRRVWDLRALLAWLRLLHGEVHHMLTLEKLRGRALSIHHHLSHQLPILGVQAHCGHISFLHNRFHMLKSIRVLGCHRRRNIYWHRSFLWDHRIYGDGCRRHGCQYTIKGGKQKILSELFSSREASCECMHT